MERLLAIMAHLRGPDGCEWDRAQDFASIAPYTIEEAYEVADAIARNDLDELKDELGDLLLQVVFHSRIAEERGAFTIDDVVAAICDKMERRHPHIFSVDDERQASWEEIKAQERAGKGNDGALDGVARGLPALLRAQKLQARAARVGFDWPDASGPRAKIDEEIAEIETAINADDRMSEVGDLLFTVVNWARHIGVDAEQALIAANAKFERRFRHMETHAGGLAGKELGALEHAWEEAKRAERIGSI